MNVSVEFRTYELTGLIMYQKFLNADSYIKVHINCQGDGCDCHRNRRESNGIMYFSQLYLDKGKLMIELQTDRIPKLNLDNFPNPFNDGLWHRTTITVGTNLITLSVDETVVETVRLISVDTGGTYIFGGGLPDTPGFVGCMRQITIDGSYRLPLNFRKEDTCCDDEPLILNACQMTDRCSPNPCEHGGICKQTSKDFECDCEGTGYSGSVCHTCKSIKFHAS